MNYEICLFPGQGSQQAGMGVDLFPLFPGHVEAARDILGYDLVDLCIHNTDNLLLQTEYTQPALFVVNALSYLKHIEEKGLPDAVLGHSLGETNALFAAGVFDFETGLRLVQKRGQLMGKCEPGGMAAVIGLPVEEIEGILQRHFPDLDIANINTSRQTVISGPRDTIQQAAGVFEDEFASYIPLKVSGAFHSRYMATAQQEFEAFTKTLQYAAPYIPVVANVTAMPYGEGQIPGLLVDQITHPVRWYDSIRYLLDKGECIFYELGPGEVLTNMVKGIQRK